MRVTAETKEATRQAILDVSLEMLRARGWENVNTRDIASAAGIANGTLFNYFRTKEAIVGALVAGVLADATDDPLENRAPQEQLFMLIYGGIRKLRPLRPFLPFVIDAIFAPAERTVRSHDTDSIRDDHLARVAEIVGTPLTAVQRHLYWTLYTGVVTFWLHDPSPKQEETLALVDQSVALFVASLERSSRERRPPAVARRATPSRRR